MPAGAQPLAAKWCRGCKQMLARAAFYLDARGVITKSLCRLCLADVWRAKQGRFTPELRAERKAAALAKRAETMAAPRPKPTHVVPDYRGENVDVAPGPVVRFSTPTDGWRWASTLA